MNAPAPLEAMHIPVANEPPKPKEKPTQFQPAGHCMGEYGLKVCQHILMFICLQCLFCIYIGKEEDNRSQAAKHQQTANMEYLSTKQDIQASVTI